MMHSDYGKSILFIGDDKQNVDLVVRALMEQGYKADKAYSILEGLQKLSEKPANILLLDHSIPGLDMGKVVSQVRQSAAHYTLIILVTESLGSTEMANLLDKGVDDFLLKPFGRAELFSRIKSRMHISWLHQQIEFTNQKVEQLSQHDELTGLFNQKALSRRLEHEIARAKRYQKWLSVLMVDMDHFKRLSDTKGKQFADHVLNQVSKVLKDWTRGIDLLGRIGEDQFIAILPDTPTGGAEKVATRLKDHIESSPFTFNNVSARATASIGIVSVNFAQQQMTLDEYFKNAKEMVEEAKKLGRNFIQKRMVS